MSIPDYEKKKIHLWKKQWRKCAVTGALLVHGKHIAMHHLLANSKVNRRLYPAYIDSVWNLVLCYNDAHITKALPKHAPEWRINLAEGLLQSRPDLAYAAEMDEAIDLYYTGIG